MFSFESTLILSITLSYWQVNNKNKCLQSVSKQFNSMVPGVTKASATVLFATSNDDVHFV